MGLCPKIELASGKATCRECGEKIARDSPCIAFPDHYGTHISTAYMHLNCLKVGEHFKDLLSDPQLSVMYIWKGGK